MPSESPLRFVPVPKGMCPAFYEIMGAGGVRSDSGEILMLANTTCELRIDDPKNDPEAVQIIERAKRKD